MLESLHSCCNGWIDVSANRMEMSLDVERGHSPYPNGKHNGDTDNRRRSGRNRNADAIHYANAVK